MLHRLLDKPLPQDQVDELIQLECSSILAACRPWRIYLFGSAARGRMMDGSDLDFMVVLQDDDDLKATKQRYWTQRTSPEWPVDVLFLTRSDFLHRSRIGGVPMVCVTDGRLLFEDTDDQTRQI